MNPSNFSELQSVRLASGIEMQQRWPTYQEQEQQKVTQVMPRLINITPSKGTEGNPVTVVVENINQRALSVRLAFNSLVVETKHMQVQGITSLVAPVPSFEQIGATDSTVPISICVMDGDSAIETWPVARFTYEFDSTTITNDTTLPPTPATTSATRGADDSYFNTNYNSFYQSLPQYTYPYTTPTTPATSDTSMNNHTDSLNYNQLLNNTTQFVNHPMLVPAFDNTAITSNVTSTYVTATSTPNLAYASSSVSQRPTSIPSTPSYYQKPTSHIPATSVANYQPYPGLVPGANLQLQGDLDTMSQNWTNEECQQSRRLVQFWRSEVGNEIHCKFGPVSQNERITNTSGQIIVSCIYWTERDDYFITSVDCIHLLESLMDMRFSVEEKNRVRRNLEGFHPLTVSKCKAESTGFFKVIMGFPNPKPRNIEKDVKVFPWKIVPYALKKIVTKYTASTTIKQHKHRPQLKSSNTASSSSSLHPSYVMSTPSVFSSPSSNASNQDHPHAFI